jgi:hypothetical protein
MTTTAHTPKLKPGGLVTVAFLKAHLDEGSDHLSIFMPLVLDAVAQLQAQTFTTSDIQEAVATTHKIAMPQQTVATLLKRAKGKKYLYRDSGRYRCNPDAFFPALNVTSTKERINESQRRLGHALQDHANRRGLEIQSTEAALDMLFRFLDQEQVALLLGSAPIASSGVYATPRERVVIAEFVQDAIANDAAMQAVLRGILEGLVLYQAAFLPDLNAVTRHFKDLRVAFDSGLEPIPIGSRGGSVTGCRCPNGIGS